MIFPWLAPVFIAFEVAQLLVAHRYIGPEQIRRNAHPLDAAVPLPFAVSFFWCLGIASDYLYQGSLMLWPNSLVQVAAMLMILISVAGFMVRRACGVKWGMVVMTFEGAMRAGFLFFAFRMMAFPPKWMTPFIFHFLK